MLESPVREGDVLAAKYRVERVLGVGCVFRTHLNADSGAT